MLIQTVVAGLLLCGVILFGIDSALGIVCMVVLAGFVLVWAIPAWALTVPGSTTLTSQGGGPVSARALHRVPDADYLRILALEAAWRMFRPPVRAVDAGFDAIGGRFTDGMACTHRVMTGVPPGKGYTDVASEATAEYLQAAGHSASAITKEIRKSGGDDWGARWMRYVIGHQHDDAPPDVTFEPPHGPEFVSRPEVFDSQEAAEIFISYYKTGATPGGDALRPVEGYTADGQLIDLRSGR